MISIRRARPADAVAIGAVHVAAWRSAYPGILWFYLRLGGKPVAEATTHVAGQPVAQTAFVWNPIERLLANAQQST
jgi:hypothetical protein